MSSPSNQPYLRRPPDSRSASAPPSSGNTGPDKTGHSNVILWFAFAMVSFLVGGWFVIGVHRLFSIDVLLAVAALAVRTAFYVSLGLFCEACLLRPANNHLLKAKRRRIALHGFWVIIMFLTLAIASDVLVFAFAGYHLTTVIRILFADGLAGVGTVMEATGLSISIGKILGGVAAIGAGLGLAVMLSRKTEAISRRWHRTVSRRAAFKTCLLAMGVLAMLDLAGYRLRNPFLWELENRRVPLAFSIVRPEATLASFRVTLKPPEPLPARISPNLPPTRPDRPDIYLVVIESLRKDLLETGVMPNFARFAEQSWTFAHPITTGNVTHYSWYGLLCAKCPIYFDVAKEDARLHGSVPLAMLREMGYQLHLLATPDTAYQQLESIVFGPNGTMLESKFHPAGHSPPERDRLVVDELIGRVKANAGGGNFYLVALDSTHFDYSWPASFEAPFVPFAKGASMMKNYHRDPAARRLVENRYKNSAAWVDSLLGEFLDALRAAGRLDRSIVIVTGDHGEAFWEHGSGTHGSDLGIEQLEVAFAMRCPGGQPTRFATVFSLLDVMPSVLASLGATPGPEAGLAGRAFQLRTKGDTSPDPGYAITFQGWNEQAFRFVLTDGTKQVVLELDRRVPMECSRLSVKDVTLAQTGETLTEQGNSAAYQALLADLPRIIEHLPFLRFR